MTAETPAKAEPVDTKEKPPKDGTADPPSKINKEDEKKEDDKASTPPREGAPGSTSTMSISASPRKLSSPTDSVLPVNMPNSMMTPNNRPPSRGVSVASAGSTGGRTTTSRRGGRTRSRSPPAGHTISQPYSGSTTPTPGQITVPGNSSVPPSPRNPSAAAAAAAAAAKSFRNPNTARTGAPSGHPSAMQYQQQPPYGSSSGGPGPSMRDPYGRQSVRQDPYAASSRYPGGPPGQRPPSSLSTSYPGGQPQRPHSRSSASYPGGPPPPGYYDPHSGSRNPSSSSHHQYRQQHPRSGSRAGPPGSRYDPQALGPDGRPISRTGGPPGSDPQNPYGYNPYHRSNGPPPPSRGGMPGGREYASQYPGGSSNSGSSSSRYGGPPGSGPTSRGGPVDSGEYSRQHHGASSNRGHTPPPHQRHQYPGGGPPPHTGHPSSSRSARQPYPGSSSSSAGQHPPSYRHGDPNARGPPPPHYRGGPPPPHSMRGGPPPGHPDYHRYYSQQPPSMKKGGEGMKSTRTVMGGATPLHLNKGPPLPAGPGGPQASKVGGYHGSSRRSADTSSRRGTAASVFRSGPPGSRPPPPESANNPKTILDSLDTPSNSFEEKKTSRGEGASGDAKNSQLSPDDPPKLRNPSNAAEFDPQRSPESKATGAAGTSGLTMSPPQLTNSLDMAPSFSLFNQSFDSLGGTEFFNVSGALDSAMLNSSTSFELKTSGSRSPSTSDNPLQLSASSSTFKLNASMSQTGIFGMSPTNSFGNGPTTSFSTNPGGSVMQLGGNDQGRSSPSQVLDFYKASSIEEADLRLSASLGSPMIGASASYSSSRPFATGMEGGPPQPTMGDNKSSSGGPYGRRSHLSPRPQRRYSGHGYRPQRASSAGTPNKDGSPRFYNFLRTNKDAFVDVTFLLPGLKSAVMESKNAKLAKKEEGFVSNENTPKRGQRARGSRHDRAPTEAESAVARRRIVSAVCAFGGTFTGSRMNNPAPPNPTSSPDSSSSSNTKSNSQSIFREKSSEPATVTPNSSGSSSTPSAGEDSANKVSTEQARYDGALPTRYYESDNRLSWEFEENPPIGPKETSQGFNWCQEINADDEVEVVGKPKKRRKTEGGQEEVTDDSDDEENKEGEEGDDSNKEKDAKGETKMRYRCKLCGQPKTNHVCPYQQSLVRSIGAIAHPAVNAFTAAEPGELAPDLKEMNNLAISAAAVAEENKRKISGIESATPSRPSPDRSSIRKSANEVDGVTSAAQVTPETLRSGSSRSPDSALSPGRISTPGSSAHRSGRSSTPVSSSRKKRSHARMSSGNAGDQADLLFVEEMELKAEQFRTVTPSTVVSENPDAFTYPALPLPYAQRKRLSDNLFSLSKEIPQLTDECAAVLREARERDLWDLAVAELMTQVVVVVHCHEGDNYFEGLRRYLLTLGFTC